MAQDFVNRWIGELTAAGFDLVNTYGYTSRHKEGEEYWNSNYPMVHTRFHFVHPKKGHLILCSYASNSNYWTTYATGFKGKAPNHMWGFDIKGTKEVGIEDFESLITYINKDK